MSREKRFMSREATLRRLARSTKEWIAELWSYDSGKAGLAMLIIFVFLAFYALAVIPRTTIYGITRSIGTWGTRGLFTKQCSSMSPAPERLAKASMCTSIG